MWCVMLRVIRDILVSSTQRERTERGKGGEGLTAACDGETQSEIVLPLRLGGVEGVVGVLDLDSTQLGTFDEDDLAGLEEVVRILQETSDWS